MSVEVSPRRAGLACPLGVRRAGLRRARKAAPDYNIRGQAHSHPPAGPSDQAKPGIK